MFFILGERERDGERGREEGVNSLHFSRFGVIKRKNKKREEEKKRLRYGKIKP